MKSIIPATAAAVALLSAGAGAQAQDTTARGVRLMDLLRSETLARTANGEEHLMSAEVGSLSSGQTRETHLVGGWAGDMRVVGYCDQYCGDLDLEVVNEHGEAVIIDDSVDDTPTVSFRALSGHSYRLRVRMYQCDEGQVCMFGAASFWR